MNRTERFVSIAAILGLLIIICMMSYFMFFSDKNGSYIPIFGKYFNRQEEQMFQKIKISFERSDNQKALNLTEDYLVDFPESTNKNKVLLITASIFYQKKDYSIAKNYIEKIVSSVHVNNDDYITAVILLGKIAKEYEQFDSVVINYLEDAYLKADVVKRGELAIYLGFAALYNKKYEDALRYFNNASGEYAIIGRARVYVDQGKYQEAIQEYLNYFSLYPKSIYLENVKNAFLKQTIYYSEYLVQAKANDKAIEYLLNIVNLFPKEELSDTALLKIASIYSLNKDYKSALTFINKAINNNVISGNEEAYYQKALIYYEMGQKNESLKLFQEFKDKYPDGYFSKKTDEWIKLITKDLQY